MSAGNQNDDNSRKKLIFQQSFQEIQDNLRGAVLDFFDLVYILYKVNDIKRMA